MERKSDNSFVGVIIEESLENESILKKVKIISTKTEKVTKKHKTPWLSRWTLHTVEISNDKIKKIVKEISNLLDEKHGDSWYADFKNDEIHFIIFRNKIFKIDRTSKEQYEEAARYGISLGIPEYQVDFSPHIKKWKR